MKFRTSTLIINVTWFHIVVGHTNVLMILTVFLKGAYRAGNSLKSEIF